MNRYVNAIAGRLSLCKPQRDSLEILHRITEISPPTKEADRNSAITAMHSKLLEKSPPNWDRPNRSCPASRPRSAWRRLLRERPGQLTLAGLAERYAVNELTPISERHPA